MSSRSKRCSRHLDGPLIQTDESSLQTSSRNETCEAATRQGLGGFARNRVDSNMSRRSGGQPRQHDDSPERERAVAGRSTVRPVHGRAVRGRRRGALTELGHGRRFRRRGRDPRRPGREPTAVRGRRFVQRLCQPADADRPDLHAADLRPGAALALGSDAGGSDRHGRFPLPHDGATRSLPSPGAGPGRGTLSGADGAADTGGNPGPRRGVAAGPLGPGDGACGSGGDAALRLGSGAFRLLRCPLDARVPVCAVPVSLDARPAGGVLGPVARGACADESVAHDAAPGRGRRGFGPGVPVDRTGSGRWRDGARSRHEARGARPARDDPQWGAPRHHCRVGPRRRVLGDDTHAQAVPAVDDAGSRRLAGDPGLDHSGGHDRGVDPSGARAGADRPGGVPVAGAPARAGGPAVAGSAALRDP